jgi:serine/threonine-protein kinase
MYVSPEQATGATVTGSSDLYSLGVVAYECLAGQPPFVADQPLAIAIMHKHDPVPPLPLDVPWQVSDLIMSMLAKTPEGRPETARHLADRADIIRDARAQTGDGYTTTASLPVIQDFPSPDYPTSRYPTGDYTDYGDPGYPTRLDGQYGDDPYYDDYPERSGSSVFARHRFITAGMGVVLCGICAVVAVVLLSGGGPQRTADDPPPRVPASATKHPATHRATTKASASAPSTNVDTAPVIPTQQPTHHQQPSIQPSPTKQKSTTAPSTPASPTAPASSSTPTSTPSLPVIFTTSATPSNPAPGKPSQ